MVVLRENPLYFQTTKYVQYLEKLQKESHHFSFKISLRFEKYRVKCRIVTSAHFIKNTDYEFKIHFVKHSHFYQQHIVKIII